MADIKKLLRKLNEIKVKDIEEVSPAELEELDGGLNVACAPTVSACPKGNEACTAK